MFRVSVNPVREDWNTKTLVTFNFFFYFINKELIYQNKLDEAYG